jgi:catechol 2,3-dioxygenase-like lactoylglutathione lyase family enzyme
MRFLLVVALATSSLFAQTNVERPHILGLAHVAFRVSDLARTSAFYENLLGFAEPFSLSGKPTIAFVKINDEQYVELFQGDGQNSGQLDHFALYTDNLAAMREYLVAQQVLILEDIHQGRIGNSFLTIGDPAGHHIEILQYSPNSLTARSKGKFLPDRRISSHITHVGILVSSMGPAMRFYQDILGFRETSRGGNEGEQPRRIDLQAPEGTDSIELLSLAGEPLPPNLRAQNHFCLVTSDVTETIAILHTRSIKGLTMSPITVQAGDNLPTRANLSDPDGARVEIMGATSAGASPTAVSYP